MALGHERDPEFLRESLPARSFAAAHHGNHFGLSHRAAPCLLEEEPRDDAAADKSNAHGDLKVELPLTPIVSGDGQV